MLVLELMMSNKEQIDLPYVLYEYEKLLLPEASERINLFNARSKNKWDVSRLLGLQRCNAKP